MAWFKKNTYPEFWNIYNEYFKKKQEQQIKNIRFVVFDTETTGLDTKNDRILSIGCIAINELKITILDQFECYLSQSKFDSSTVKIHGLLKEGNLSKVNEELAIKNFLDYIQDAVLVAHHARFDITMINNALLRLGLPKLKNKVIDTGNLFLKTKLDTSKTHYNLDELSKKFNITLHDRHTASGDAYITALLFLKIIFNLKEKGIITLSQLIKPNHRRGLL